MKKKNIFMIGVLLLAFNVMPVMATEPEPSGTIDFSTIEGNLEYEEYIENQSLTESQIAEGYKIVDGTIYSPEELSGEASRLEDVKIKEPDDVTVSGNIIVNSNEGYVTFKLYPDEEIHETCFVQFMNKNNYEEYAYYVYETNGFTSSLALPYGDYIITGGGIPNDFKNEYPIESKEFTVKKGVALLVELNIGNNDNSSREKIVINTDDAEVQVEKQNQIIKHTMSWKNVVLSVLLFGSLAAIGYLIYSKIHNRN